MSNKCEYCGMRTQDIIIEVEDTWMNVCLKCHKKLLENSILCYKMIRCIIKCNTCGDILETKNTDYNIKCSCGRCYVRGNNEIWAMGGSPWDYTDLSIRDTLGFIKTIVSLIKNNNYIVMPLINYDSAHCSCCGENKYAEHMIIVAGKRIDICEECKDLILGDI